MNNLDTYILTVKNSLTALEGELYKFQNDKVKKSGLMARKALMTMIKSAHAMRKLIQEDVKAMPIAKKNISKARLEEMAQKRRNTWAEKKAKSKKKKE